MYKNVILSLNKCLLSSQYEQTLWRITLYGSEGLFSSSRFRGDSEILFPSLYLELWLPMRAVTTRGVWCMQPHVHTCVHTQKRKKKEQRKLRNNCWPGIFFVKIKGNHIFEGLSRFQKINYYDKRSSKQSHGKHDTLR